MKPLVTFFTFRLPRYKTIGRYLYPRIRYYNPETLTPRYREAAYRFTGSMLLTRRPDVVSRPYYNPELMALLHRHLPGWRDFQTEYYTYVQANWSSIYGDWDWSSIEIVHDEEQPLLQRDRLMQIFGACPEGSYGYYAMRGLAPFKMAVGSFASATIDEFFASNIEILKQPFSELVNDIMSTKETAYWDSQQQFIDWFAGQRLRKVDRERVVRWAALLSTFFEGRRTGSGDLTDEQLQQVKDALESLTVTSFEYFVKDDAAALKAWRELRKKD